MPIFAIDKGNLKQISRKSIDLEKDIQGLVERNLHIIFGFEFVTSEFELNGLRVDTLGFNRDTNSFVIIEFKRDKNVSVIDQGYAYLALLLNNKADFILLYHWGNGDYEVKVKDFTDMGYMLSLIRQSYENN